MGGARERGVGWMLALEWTEGEEVTSGENLYGEVGGVATGDFSFL